MDKPVKHIDHMMWDMEMPTSLVTVVGMMVLDAPLTRKDVEYIIETRLLQYDKFRQKIIMKNNKPYWHDDENFEVRAHVGHVALPSPGDYKTLQEMVGYLMAIPLDYSKPLWKVHLIENYNGGSAIIWRIHHAIADGIGLIKVVFSLTGHTVEDSLKEVHFLSPDPEKKEFFLDRMKERLDHVVHLGEDLYKEAREMLADPKQLRDALKESWETTRELAKLVTEKPRRDSLYKGQLGVTKMVAWSPPVALDLIKKAGRNHDATVNDVLLALMSGAIRKHLIRHDQDATETFRVICPVNFRREEKIRVDNRIGMISLNLPVHLEDVTDRIRHTTELTRKLKRSMEPAAIYSLLNLAGDFLPKKLELKAAEYIGERIMGVLSNVPGPREAVYFSGVKIRDIMFWIPQTSALGVGISIISYDNRVSVGVSTDAHIIDDPDFLMEAFREEYNAMVEMMEGAGD